jgi:D-lactate dehydrogenase
LTKSSSPAPETAPLPAAAVTRLGEIFGARLLTDPADCLPYGYDNSRRVVLPQAVVFPQAHDEVTALASACSEHALPLTARGRGTNTTGATVPVAGGVVASFERMNRILRVSPGDRLLECEAGAINGDVQAAATKHGLFWAPDPTSAGYSTVGGNLACSAGGPRAVKYGTARDNVLGLRAVTGAGAALKTGCYTTKGVVGYDLTRLIVGSEGTLALITEASLKLLPKPETTRTLRACYRDENSAAAAVARLMAQPETPSALEFMDGDSVRLAEDYQRTGIPAGTGALLLIEVDGAAAAIEAAVAAVSAAARGEGLVDLRAAASEAESAALWACRKALSPALRKRLAPAGADRRPRRAVEEALDPHRQLRPRRQRQPARQPAGGSRRRAANGRDRNLPARSLQAGARARGHDLGRARRRAGEARLRRLGSRC